MREYSRAEEEFIIKYIARHHPSEKGRKGNAIYQSMATDPGNVGKRSWQSLRQFYVGRWQELDKKINKQLNAQGATLFGSESSGWTNKKAAIAPTEDLPHQRTVKGGVQEQKPSPVKQARVPAGRGPLSLGSLPRIEQPSPQVHTPPPSRHLSFVEPEAIQGFYEEDIPQTPVANRTLPWSKLGDFSRESQVFADTPSKDEAHARVEKGKGKRTFEHISDTQGPDKSTRDFPVAALRHGSILKPRHSDGPLLDLKVLDSDSLSRKRRRGTFGGRPSTPFSGRRGLETFTTPSVEPARNYPLDVTSLSESDIRSMFERAMKDMAREHGCTVDEVLRAWDETRGMEDTGELLKEIDEARSEVVGRRRRSQSLSRGSSVHRSGRTSLGSGGLGRSFGASGSGSGGATSHAPRLRSSPSNHISPPKPALKDEETSPIYLSQLEKIERQLAAEDDDDSQEEVEEDEELQEEDQDPLVEEEEGEEGEEGEEDAESSSPSRTPSRSPSPSIHQQAKIKSNVWKKDDIERLQKLDFSPESFKKFSKAHGGDLAVVMQYLDTK